MKWIFKRGLLAAPAIIFYSLFSFHACLVSGCKAPSSSDVRLSAYSTDSTGPGGNPKIIILTSGNIPAGSSVVLDCTSPDCKLRLNSTDSTGHTGGLKRLNLGTIPVDIPENTELVLRVIPRGDPAMTDSTVMVK
jgi:hypothetical protein